MAKIPYVSIIIINFKRADDTILALESIKKLDYPRARMQVILIDNLPEIHSKKVLEKWITKNTSTFFDLKYVANTENIGLSNALNQAQKLVHQKCSYIWRFDNDALADSQALKELITVIDSDPSIGFVGSSAYNYDNRDQFTDGAWNISYWLGYAFQQPNSKVPTECDYVAGRSQLFPTHVVKEIGYIADPIYFAYFEDVDFCVQVKHKGYKVVYVPSSIVYHRYDPQGETAAYKVHLMTRNRVLFMRKNASILQFVFFSILFSTAGTVAFLIFLFRRKKEFVQIISLFNIYIRSLLEGFFTSTRNLR